ncbi:MAG TPA: DUF4397 domain-containing protein [Bacillota bacterium]|nr:DUF4397 domain-containing protein [Bacillota bacterium]HOK69586.1 DUF4397 domain-containing protein [Bacillota bacterium]HPP85980.1 DUF4397 domain-containing protein [Bacillota bacterium]
MNNQFLGPNGNVLMPQETAYIRLFHASPDAPAVDVYANGTLIAKGLLYKQITQYLRVPTGNYTIQVFPVDQKMNPIISATLDILPNTAQTIAAVGMLSEIMPHVIQEEFMPQIDPNKVYIRFVHLSPNTPAVDVTLRDGTKIFENVEFTESTDYIEVDPRTYAVQVRLAGTDLPILSLPSVVLKSGIVNSVYTVGLLQSEPPLEALLITDSSYIP